MQYKSKANKNMKYCGDRMEMAK